MMTCSSKNPAMVSSQNLYQKYLFFVVETEFGGIRWRLADAVPGTADKKG
jgi:hypothetical protein